MIATGYILYFALPPETNKSLSLWGWTRHQWGQVHFWISVGVLAVLLVHVALHWQWLVVTLAQRMGLARNPQNRHVRSGVLTLLAGVAVLVLFAWVTEVSVRERGDPPYPVDSAVGSSVADSNPSPSLPEDARSQVDFWKDVNPILESSCLGCHGPSRALGNFRVDRRDDYFSDGPGAALVVRGNSAESPLIAIVSGQRPGMASAAVHKLPEHKVEVLRAWIDAGAEWPVK